MQTYTEVYISEAYVPQDFNIKEIITEDKKGNEIKKYLLEGIFQEAEKQNKNRRKYKIPLLERETGRLVSLIKEQNGLPSELDHPLPGKEERDLVKAQRTSLSNACALIQLLEMNGPKVYGKAEILWDDGSDGTKLYSMVKRGFRPGISSRGLGGKPLVEGDSLIVPDDYRMVTYDMVSNPSTHNAILESIVEEQLYIMKESQRPSNVRSMWQVITDFNKGK